MSHKISFCTVSMNRLAHLRQTLPANLKDNEMYGEAEFLILDYNSTDGLERFIKKDMAEYIENGRIRYYRTITPAFFNRSLSRNIALKLADGEILVNLDADNYTGKNFAFYINDQFEKKESIFMAAIGQPGAAKQDALGRICIRKRDFYAVSGFDERMVHYGFEDYDLINRLEFSGLKNVAIDSGGNYLRAITHQQKERTANEFMKLNFHFILFRYLSPASTEITIFFKNGTFQRATMLDNKTYTHKPDIDELQRSQLKYPYSILDNIIYQGEWSGTNDQLLLWSATMDETETLKLNAENNRYEYEKSGIVYCFYKIIDPDLIEEAIMFISQVGNRITMDENNLLKQSIVNNEGFGRDTVYRNFDYTNPITI